MELLDRYLNAVGFWLPRKQKDDILAELAEDLRAQIEDTEAGLNRAINEDELTAILNKCGAPLVVASRYLPQSYVVGPLLFPIYRFVLKLVLFGYLVPWLAVWIGFVVFSPGYRMAHSGAGLLETLAPLWSIAVNAFAIITIGFWLIDVTGASKKLVSWDPRKLPPVRDPNRVPLSSSLADVIINGIFLLWWLGYPHIFSIAYALERAGIHGDWGTVWPDYVRNFYWPVALTTAVMIALSLMNVRRPYWTRERLGIRLGVHAAITGMCGYILATHYVEVRTQMSQFAGHAIVSNEVAMPLVVNLIFYVAFLSVALGCAAVCVHSVYRIARWTSPPPPSNSMKRSGGAFVILG